MTLTNQSFLAIISLSIQINMRSGCYSQINLMSSQANARVSNRDRRLNSFWLLQVLKRNEGLSSFIYEKELLRDKSYAHTPSTFLGLSFREIIFVQTEDMHFTFIMCILIFHQLACVITGHRLALCIFNYYFSRNTQAQLTSDFIVLYYQIHLFIGFSIFPASDCLIFLLLYKTGSIKSSFVLLGNSYFICIFM